MEEKQGVLFDTYKTYSDDKLKEVTVENGYTQEAERVAKQILSSDRTNYETCTEAENAAEENDSGDTYTRNNIATCLKAVGIIIFVVGTMSSFIYADDSSYEYSWGKFFLYEAGTVISGMLFLGFGEVVRLLQNIKEKLK